MQEVSSLPLSNHGLTNSSAYNTGRGVSHNNPLVNNYYLVFFYVALLIALGFLALSYMEENINVIPRNPEKNFVFMSSADTLFLVVSAVTNTGLTSYAIQELSFYSYVVIGVLMLLGGTTLDSLSLSLSLSRR